MTAEPTLRVLLVVAHCTDSVGRHVRSLSAGLRQRGHHVVVAGPSEAERAFGFSGVGARFVATSIADTLSARELSAARSLARWVKGADVVHAHGLVAGAVALSAGAGQGWPVAGVRVSGVPLVVSWHRPVLVGGWKGELLQRLAARVARGATLSLGASHDLVETVAAAGGHATPVLLTASAPTLPARARVQVREELGVGNAPMVLAAGRLHAQKGYPTLVEAMALLQGRQPRPVLVIAGDGPEEDRLRQLVAEKEVATHLLGYRQDVADLMGAADVLALASTWEASPPVVQQAMQLGLAVVATDVGGVGELVGDDALLVAAGDGPAMAGALAEVLDHPEEATTRAQRAQVRAAAWPDEGALVDDVLAHYLSLDRSPIRRRGARV